MYFSSEDMAGLVAELNEKRLPKIVGKLVKSAGGKNPLTEPERELLINVRRIRSRFVRGEMTHDDNDESRMKAAMDWAVTKHAEQIGQSPDLSYEFDKRRLRRSEPLPRNYYVTTALQRMAEEH